MSSGASFFSDFVGPHPDVLWDPGFLSPVEHDELFALCQALPWTVPEVFIQGRSIPVPREILWYGDVEYRYSGIRHRAQPLPPALSQLAGRIEHWLQERGVAEQFNSVLMNRYRSGKDSIGMHSDNEEQLGPQPVIASISLGLPRTFVFEHKKQGIRHREVLSPGSLLVMKGDCQDEWRHGIPKEPAAQERINLTFRHTRNP